MNSFQILFIPILTELFSLPDCYEILRDSPKTFFSIFISRLPESEKLLKEKHIFGHYFFEFLEAPQELRSCY